MLDEHLPGPGRHALPFASMTVPDPERSNGAASLENKPSHSMMPPPQSRKGSYLAKALTPLCLSTSMLGVLTGRRRFSLLGNILQHLGHLCEATRCHVATDDAEAIWPRGQNDVLSLKACSLQPAPDQCISVA
jgi:hypothetical protein